jgi:hypothetical protein
MIYCVNRRQNARQEVYFYRKQILYHCFSMMMIFITNTPKTQYTTHGSALTQKLKLKPEKHVVTLRGGFVSGYTPLYTETAVRL